MAEPGFDDSQWETVDLTPAEGSFDPMAGTSGYVPGWTARGHAGYWGYAWYRIRVQLDEAGAARPGEKLALEGPDDFDDVFQVFSNGRLLGGFGDFSAKTPVTYYSVPTLFPLPTPAGSLDGEAAGGSGAVRTEMVAFRVWMGPGELVTQPDAGGLHSPPVLGQAGAVAADYQLRWLEKARVFSPDAALGLLFALMAVAAFTLVLFDRSDRVYLWIGAVFLLQAIYCGMDAFDSWTQQLSATADVLLHSCLMVALILAGWVMVWWIWFGRQRPAWIPRAAAGLALLYMVSHAIGHEVFFGLVPHGVAAQFEMALLVARVLFFALMLWIVIRGIRSQGLEGWLVLPAVLLRGIAVFSPQLLLLHIRLSVHLFGAYVTLADLAPVLMALAVVLLLLLRRRRRRRQLLRSVKAQRERALDVKQAQEVQQVILPQARVLHPGLTIESVYRPARQVGEDFFQILPHDTDGSLLIVAGDVASDVAGKGLQAGMLVALLVGAIRTALESSDDPAVVLGVLNRRLTGRSPGATTCLALRITASGDVTLANAGHMPPYLNGQPVATEGALPLGIFVGAEPSVMRFTLKHEDRLALISAGIVEAMDADGQLFGFERIQALLNKQVTAVEVADAARNFGQQDDISVITVARTAVLKPALG